jgi:hypothetical protein
MVEVGVAVETLRGVEDQVGLQLLEPVDHRLDVVVDPDQEDLVALLPEGVGDLVLHLRLVRLPGGDLGLHLSPVVLVLPARVGRIEDHRDLHCRQGDGSA